MPKEPARDDPAAAALASAKRLVPAHLTDAVSGKPEHGLLDRILHFHRHALVLPGETAEPGLRRCAACGTQSFSPLRRCACGKTLATLDLELAYSGRDDLLARAERVREGGARVVQALLAALWIVTALALAVTVIDYGPLGIAFYGFFLLAFALIGHTLVVAAARFAIARAAPPPRPAIEAPLETVRARLDEVCDRLVVPFLERNAVAEGTSGATVSPGEVELLRRALEDEKVPLPAERAAPFIAACCLRRDFASYRKKLEAASSSETDKDALLAHAIVVPEETEASLALIRAFLAERNEANNVERISPLLAARRDELGLRRFKSDLAERRAGPGSEAPRPGESATPTPGSP